jgi:hypothetical protein
MWSFWGISFCFFVASVRIFYHELRRKCRVIFWNNKMLRWKAKSFFEVLFTTGYKDNMSSVLPCARVLGLPRMRPVLRAQATHRDRWLLRLP